MQLNTVTHNPVYVLMPLSESLRYNYLAIGMVLLKV